MDNANLEKTIHKLYDKLSYFDMYGTSIIFFIIMTIFVFLVHSYCIIMQTSSEIKDDWINQRCKPQVIPFAGFINKPDDKTSFQYTGENFNYCVQNILTNITGYFVQPFNFLISSLTKVFDEIKEGVNNTRNFMGYFRDKIQVIVQDIMSRTLNIIVPIQRMFIALIDSLGKTQGVMTAGLYTLLGTYYTLQSVLGAIVEFIVDILLVLVVLIVGLWVLPFTYPMAMTMTVMFLAISIPLAVITIFMTDVLHVQTSAIPQLRCFDKYTLIGMKDGSYKHIHNIKPGDILKNNDIVTATMKVDSRDLKMFYLHNIIVSESHYVYYKGKWILTRDHPEAILLNYYVEPYLYCLNTSSKIITINNIVFSDWDEVFDDKLENILKKVDTKENIHKYLDKGFDEDTLFKLFNGSIKQMKDIQIGDTLEDGSIVYGIVEIEKENLEQNKNIFSKEKDKKLFNLLTNSSKFIVDNIVQGDYNSIIDLFE